MALRNERMTTAAIPEVKLEISMPGITWLASNTENPVITHRIRNPLIPASYRPCGRGLKPHPPMASETPSLSTHSSYTLEQANPLYKKLKRIAVRGKN